MRLTGTGSVNYVADWIMDVLDDLVGHVDQDLVVETSIDPVLQAAAEQALVEELAEKGARLNVQQGAVVAMTPQGAVRALVGGKNYAREPIQPRGVGQAAAGLGIQALRLSHRAGARAHPRYHPRGQADQHQRLASGELRAPNIPGR